MKAQHQSCLNNPRKDCFPFSGNICHSTSPILIETCRVIEIFHQDETKEVRLVHNQYLYLIDVVNELPTNLVGSCSFVCVYRLNIKP